MNIVFDILSGKPPNWCWAILFVVFILLFRKNWPQVRPKVKASYKALDKLQQIDQPGQQFSYLRKIDPFVYEEMILSSLKNLGYKIQRNKRYTGDGGIDGQVFVDGKKVLIQAKRYGKHINPQHVKDFTQICQGHGCSGLFIHTGITGKESYRSTDGTVKIVSGAKMLDLLTCRGFSL